MLMRRNKLTVLLIAICVIFILFHDGWSEQRTTDGRVPYGSEITVTADTLFSASVASIRALDAPAIRSLGGLLGSAGSGLITSTEWGPEIRLTYVSDSVNITSNPFGAVRNDTVFVAFSLHLYGDDSPFLIASFNGGELWSEIWCVSNEDTADAASHFYPLL